MKMNSLVAAIAIALIVGSPVSAQSAADLLQKGIYAQETAGDLDAAIRIFRQVANAASGNKSVAAQAQYQLVLCMLQRGDGLGAAKEVEALARNFPDQPELVNRARKLLPGTSATLTVPWGEGESSQLNIKRDGADTGAFLFYSVDPSPVDWANQATPNMQSLRWELRTKKSKRSALLKVDRITGQATGKPSLALNDETGDPDAEALAGPAIDIQGSVYAIRRMPLAVGYKTTLTTLPLTLSHMAPRDFELAVTGMESVEVTAGKFKCYKVSFAALGQTFWIGVDGTRPLVKFKSGNTEAELVKTWGAGNFVETELAFFRDAGWRFGNVSYVPGPETEGSVSDDTGNNEARRSLWIKATQIYTPAAKITEALRDRVSSYKCRPESIQTRTIGGQQAASCIVGEQGGQYHIWIRTEGAAIEMSSNTGPDTLGLLRWYVDRALATAKRIP